MMFDAEVDVVCPFCGKTTTIQVIGKDFYAWKFEGALIQNAMPYLPANVRETLISGLCDECQEKMFSSSEEEEEDFEPDDIDDDCGFDPFEGCFTYDC